MRATAMIRNERQYRASHAHRRRLLETRAAYEATPQSDALAQAALLSSVDWLLGDVEAEIAEYEALRAGTVREMSAEGLESLPDLLVRARIGGRLTQRQLAERLGVAEEAVQRDEAGGYAHAGLDRLARVAEALEVLPEALWCAGEHQRSSRGIGKSHHAMNCPTGRVAHPSLTP